MKSLQRLTFIALAFLSSTAWAQAPDATQGTGATPAPRRFFGRTQPAATQEPLMPPGPTNAQPVAPTSTNDGVSRPVTPAEPTPRVRPRPSTRNTNSAATGTRNRTGTNGNSGNTRERVITPRSNNADDEVVASERPTPRPRAGTSAPSAADEATSAVADLLDAANRGQYTKSATMLTPQLIRYLESDTAAAYGGLKGALDRLTRDGDVSGWETVARARGEGARAETKVTYRSGQTENVVFELIRSDGRWKVSVSPIWIGSKASGGGSSPVAMSSFRATAPAIAPAPVASNPAPSAAPVGIATDAPPAPTSAPAAALGNRTLPTESAATPASNPAPSTAPSTDPRPTPMATPRPALSDVPWQVDLRPQDVLKEKQPEKP